MIDATVNKRPSSHTLNTPVVAASSPAVTISESPGRKNPIKQARLGKDDRGQSDIAAPCDDAADVANFVKQVEQPMHAIRGGGRAICLIRGTPTGSAQRRREEQFQQAQ